MSVVLTPSNALGFNRPLTQHVKRTLGISNHNAQPVAFKVKTTAPKLYCVRPNSGRVEPGETVEVQVMLQAMKEEPALNAKCKDKFLIQSTLITAEKETMSLGDLWADNSDEVHSQKIRVVYLPPEGQTVPEEEESMSMMANISDPNIYGTVRQHPSGNGYAHQARQPSGDSGVPHQEEDTHHDAPSTPPPTRYTTYEPPPQQDPEEDVGIVNVNVHPPQPAPQLSSASAPEPNTELMEKLEEAQAEIERLRHLISSMPEPSTAPTAITSTTADLRRRRPTSPSDDTSTTWDGETEVGTYVEDPIAPEGVPLQIVIIIALGVFVTTYLFF